MKEEPTTGELTKLKIIAYKDISFNEQNGIIATFTTLLNPEKISLNYKTEIKEEKRSGSSKPIMKFIRSKAQDLELKLLFDETGIIQKKNTNQVVFKEKEHKNPDEPKDKLNGIAKNIADFNKMVHAYNGDSHRPNYLKISWGTFLFKGMLFEMNIDYKLFDSNGHALRADVITKYKSCEAVALTLAKENSKSPDLTHRRLVKAGDTLPLMCHSIYGNSKYYLEVAKANKILNHRNLTPGLEIFFPPITKASL